MKDIKYKFTVVKEGYSDTVCGLCGQMAFDSMGKCMNCGNYIGC